MIIADIANRPVTLQYDKQRGKIFMGSADGQVMAVLEVSQAQIMNLYLGRVGEGHLSIQLKDKADVVVEQDQGVAGGSPEGDGRGSGERRANYQGRFTEGR